MAKKLIAHVSIRDAGGALHSLAPGDEVPEWAEDRLTNEDLFAPAAADETPAPEAPEPDPAPEAPAAADKTPDFTKPAPRAGRRRTKDA
ncbi:MAG: hypothetical protein LBE25_13455 [Arthrobacter sp.]|nr:hypothetical protein [Arthrobacter sp.]